MPKASRKRRPSKQPVRRRPRRSKATPAAAATTTVDISFAGSGSLCRVCANWFPDRSSGMVSLASRTILGDECSPADVILAIGGGSSAVEDDGLPEFCCRECFDRLEEAYRVRNMCRESELKLRGLLEQDQVEEGDINPLDAIELVCKAEEPEVREEVVEERMDVKNEPVWEDDENTMEDDGFEDNVEDEAESKEPAVSKRKLAPTISEDLYEEIPVAFRCCGCKMQFQSDAEMKEHGLAVHGSKKLSAEELGIRAQCDICYKVLKGYIPLSKHKAKDHVEYRCKTCGDTFISKPRMSTHYRTIHGPNANVTGNTRICCGCAESFASLEDLMAHSEAVHLPSKPPPNQERPFVCDICYHNFPTNQGLYLHKTRLTTKVKKYVCSQCGKRYLHPGQLSDHEKTHLGEKVFKCTECSAAFFSRETLRKHIQRHVWPTDKFKCTECGRCYRSSKALKEHTNLHTGERPFACTYCPNTFARETSLAKHVKMHRGQKDYECSICGKRFGDSSGLRQHVSFYHNQERPFGCFFCERRYPRKDYRRRHMESAHAAELLANPVPAIELAGSTQWTKLGENKCSE